MPSSTPRAAATRRLARAAVAVTATAVAVAAFSSPAAAAEADGGAAAGWLAAQADGANFGTAGATADAVVALVSADAASGVTADAIAWLSDPSVLGPYIGNASDGYKAAQVAKIMLAADAAGADVTDFGGVDLEAALRGLEGDDGVFGGSSATVLSQSLAVLSLDRTDGGAPSAAVDALADKQCANGSYGFTFDTCDDADATGYAASALLADGGGSASESALDWLESVQKSNGAFVAGYPGAPENTNSTGVAGQALASGGRDDAAGKARGFIAGLQNGCDAAEADRGGIAYDASGFDPVNAVMSTSQAIPAVTGEGLLELDPSDDTAELPVLDCDGDGNGDGNGSGNGNGSGDGDTAGKLPVTGNSLTWPIVLGAATVLTGAGLVLISRRAKTAGRSS